LLQHVLSPSFSMSLSGAECVSAATRKQHAHWLSQWPSIRVNEWYSDSMTRLTSTQYFTLISALYRRIVQREPLAYITGTRHFWSHLFWVQTHPATPQNARAFIPRPETELVCVCVCCSHFDTYVFIIFLHQLFIHSLNHYSSSLW
jgi:methylase of polypeptide subunit release factors